MYNLLGSHDTERILTLVNGNFEQLKLIMLMQFAFIGAPAIYCGDEIGLTGGKDPECRKSFLWNEGEWNHEIREWTKSLCKARRDSKALRRGSMEFQHSSVPGTVVLERRYENELVTIFCNSWQKPARYTWKSQSYRSNPGIWRPWLVRAVGVLTFPIPVTLNLMDLELAF